MAGKIWSYDTYDLRKFSPREIKCVVDIGANVGTTSIMAKILNPFARIVSLEPSPVTYDRLVKNMKEWSSVGIECHNVALGDGSDMCLIEKKRAGMHRFCNESEKQWWPEHQRMTPSKTLFNIFKDYKISTSEPFILKIDCEGGERFLLSKEQEEHALDIIRKSIQTIFEIHLPFGGKPELWNIFFKKLSDTHEMKSNSKGIINGKKIINRIPCKEFLFKNGRPEIILTNKNWKKEK